MNAAQLAVIYRSRDKMSRQERTRATRQLAGSPLGTLGIAALLNLSEREVRKMMGYYRRGGKLNITTIPDIAHLAYLHKIGARLDRVALERVLSAGTSQASVAALMGISRQRLHQIIKEEL